ncbi:MAG: condensation domain-containing protein, partial [Blastocatellia bacterium]
MNSKDIEAIYPLSPMQQGILFHTLYDAGSGEYVVQLVCSLKGELNVCAFEQAWNAAVARHTSLRTSFAWKTHGEPLQLVRRRVGVNVGHQDWRKVDHREQEELLNAHLQEDRARGFGLNKAPLMRMEVMRTERRSCRFVWSCHHVVLDGWSLPLLLKEVLEIYEAHVQGREPKLGRARPYEDYIDWLRRQDMAGAEKYWRQLLKGLSEPTTLGMDGPGNNRAGDAGQAEERLSLSKADTARLVDYAKAERVTLSTIVQGAWAVLLSRYSGQADVLFGMTVSGRPAELAGVGQMVGLFINTLPVRIEVIGARRTADWLRALQQQQAETRQYEYSSLVQIHGWSELPRGLALFESIVVFENYPVNGDGVAARSGLNVDDMHSVEQNNYPITFSIQPGNALEFMISYARRRFERASVRRMLEHLERLVAGIGAGARLLRDIQMLGPGERYELVVERNATRRHHLTATGLPDLFEEQAERTPEAVGVVCGAQRHTYLDLNNRANQLARYLRRLEVGPEKSVGILMERSVDMVVAILAVLKAGGAYVPLDAAYPQERIEYIVADAGLRVIVSETGLRSRVAAEGVKVLCIDSARAV